MNSIKKQAGSMLMSALFIAILMLALGLALVNILSSSAHNNAVEYYGARAFLAAQSGIEKKLTELFPIPSGTGPCTDSNVPLSSTYLSNCTVATTCTEISNIPDFSSTSTDVTVYRLTSSATCNVNNCVSGPCLKDFWQTQRSISVEAKTLN